MFLVGLLCFKIVYLFGQLQRGLRLLNQRRQYGVYCLFFTIKLLHIQWNNKTSLQRGWACLEINLAQIL